MRKMKAIILAAGVGKRLQGFWDQPKCLLMANGQTLIERHLQSLWKGGIKTVTVVVGYKRGMVIQALLEAGFPGQLRIIENPDFREGSILSLWAARSELNGDVVLMDADVYFEEEVLSRLLASPHENAIIIDTASRGTGEEMIAGVKGKRVIDLWRSLTGNFDVMGEWVGFLKFGREASQKMKEITRRQIEEGCRGAGYEALLPLLFRETAFGFEIVDGLKWMELDFPEEVQRLNALVGEGICS